jgi:hypothetical protein
MRPVAATTDSDLTQTGNRLMERDRRGDEAKKQIFAIRRGKEAATRLLQRRVALIWTWAIAVGVIVAVLLWLGWLWP